MLNYQVENEIGVLVMQHGRANAFDLELLQALRTELKQSVAHNKALVLGGQAQVFSAGVDLVRLLREDSSYTDAFLEALVGFFHDVFEYPRPIVAAVNGHAIAGGCITMMACDWRVVAQGSAKIGVPELMVGVPFPSIALEVLRFACPRRHLQQLTFQGALWTAPECVENGLIEEICDAASIWDRAKRQAQSLARIPTNSFQTTKSMLRDAALKNCRSLTDDFEKQIRSAWKSPQVRQAIQDYVARTLGK